MRGRMAHEAPIYDLNVLLDSALDEDRREKILADVETLIVKHGELLGSHDWGVRPTAYEVRKHADASYHLIQFHATPELLLALDHSLKITDGVLRHRVIKLKPGTPAPPESRPAAFAATGEGDE
jgi:small subunit ribosomal protein S6